jgi:hypothetical protein
MKIGYASNDDIMTMAVARSALPDLAGLNADALRALI